MFSPVTIIKEEDTAVKADADIVPIRRSVLIQSKYLIS